ncbi:MAG: hypothetical protein ABW318_10900 [Vicinamibacterales bacterium]
MLASAHAGTSPKMWVGLAAAEGLRLSSRPLGRYPQIDFQSRDDELEAHWCAPRKILELLETLVLSTIPYPIHRINWVVYWNQTQVSTNLPMRASGCSGAPKKNPDEMDSEA